MIESKYLKDLPQIGYYQMEGNTILKCFGSPVDFDDITIITNKGYFNAIWSDDGYYDAPLSDQFIFKTYYYAADPFEFKLTPLGQWLKDNNYLRDYSEFEKKCKEEWEEQVEHLKASDRKLFEKLKKQYGWS